MKINDYNVVNENEILSITCDWDEEDIDHRELTIRYINEDLDCDTFYDLTDEEIKTFLTNYNEFLKERYK